MVQDEIICIRKRPRWIPRSLWEVLLRWLGQPLGIVPGLKYGKLNEISMVMGQAAPLPRRDPKDVAVFKSLGTPDDPNLKPRS
jgi:hypothetical protein